MVVPVDAPEDISAFTADHNLRETVGTAVYALLPVRTRLHIPAPHHFFLHAHIKLFRDDCLMIIFHIVLRCNAVVLYTSLIQNIDGAGFLEQGIPDVLLIGEDFAQGTGMPPTVPCSRQNAICFQTLCDHVQAGSFQIFPIDALYNLCLLRINDEMPFVILSVAQKAVVVHLHLSLLIAEINAQLHIFTNGFRFLLRKGCHNCNQDFSFGIHRVDVFLLEIDRNALFLQQANVFQAVQRIPGKPADGLGNDHIDLTGCTSVNHAIKLCTLFRVGAGNAIIGEDTGQRPLRVALDQLRIMPDLGFIAGGLFVAVGADTAVCCHTEFFLKRRRYTVCQLSCRDNCHIFHTTSSCCYAHSSCSRCGHSRCYYSRCYYSRESSHNTLVGQSAFLLNQAAILLNQTVQIFCLPCRIIKELFYFGKGKCHRH